MNPEVAMTIKKSFEKYQDVNQIFKEIVLRNTDLVQGVPNDTIWELSYGLKMGLVDWDRYLICSGEKRRIIYFILSGNVEISLYCIN